MSRGTYTRRVIFTLLKEGRRVNKIILIFFLNKKRNFINKIKTQTSLLMWHFPSIKETSSHIKPRETVKRGNKGGEKLTGEQRTTASNGPTGTDKHQTERQRISRPSLSPWGNECRIGRTRTTPSTARWWRRSSRGRRPRSRRLRRGAGGLPGPTRSSIWSRFSERMLESSWTLLLLLKKSKENEWMELGLGFWRVP